eukprot:s4552_g3.t1
MTCLRCGKLGHRIANCPQPAQSAKVTEPVAATSSFICYNDLEQDTAYVTGLTTAEAVKKGMAVIDGGATRTLASVPAMEAIMSINHQKHGHNGVSTVDLVDRPVFGFGNGSENQCSSTVHLKIAANASPGSLKVHCLDQGSGPLLLSVESLRKLGAIVDFAEDMICFRSLDAQKIVQANAEEYDLEEPEFDPDLDEEDQALWAGAEEEAQGALAAIEQAKRTLRAARTRQHNVRMARQYYRPQQGRGIGGMGRGRGPGQRDDSQMTCLRCRKLGHRIANCPQPAQSAKVTEPAAATSSFICYNDLEQDTAYVTGLTTAEAVKKGMAVIDGGATHTLASVPTMEAIMSINHQKHGHNGVSTVDLVDRPVFGFGNGSENQCSSTVHLKIAANASPGSLKVHCLDQGSGPLLLSVESLRKLGAIVDFAEDMICFRSLDAQKIVQVERSGPLLLSVESLRKLGAIVDFAEDMICFRSLDAQKIVQVERSTTGHQLLSMTEDIMTRAKAARVAVPSLREYLAETARDSSSGLSFPQKNRRVP